MLSNTQLEGLFYFIQNELFVEYFELFETVPQILLKICNGLLRKLGRVKWKYLRGQYFNKNSHISRQNPSIRR